MLKPEFLNVEMVFTSDQLEKLFSEYVSEKAGFPVEIQLQYDDEHFRLWASVDESRYSTEQLKKIADLGGVSPDDSLWTAYLLVYACFGQGLPEDHIIDISCEPDGDQFLVVIKVPYDHFQNNLRYFQSLFEASGDNKGQTIYVAKVTHKRGVDAFAARTKEEVLEDLAAYAREWWSYEFQEPIPEDLSNEELVEHYFDRHPTEEYQLQVASFNA